MRDSVDTLHELFRYHIWAILTVMDYCANLPSEALHESAPGTSGAILDTLVHLMAGEQRYLRRLPVEPPRTVVREGRRPALVELRAFFLEQATLGEALLDGGAELDVTMPELPDWPETQHAETLLMLQCLHHGNDYRTHVCTVLSANGRSAPEIHGCEYWAAMYRQRA